MPWRTPWRGLFRSTTWPSISIRPALRGRRAEQPFEQFGAAGADESGEAEDLAGAHFEIHVLRPAGNGDAADLEHRRSGRGHILGRIHVRDIAADHQVGHLLAGRFGRRRPRHEATVAHDDDFIGDAFHLVELVRDVDDGHALGLELGDQGEQALGLCRRQGGRRFIHDQQAGVARDGLGDLDELLLGDNQPPYLGFRVGLQADSLHGGLGGGVHRAVVEEQPLLLLVAEEDVLGDGQVFGEVEFLVDQDDAFVLGFARIGETMRHAVDREIAFGGLLVAGEDLDQRRLSGAVLAEQADDLARFQREADAVQDFNEAETFGDGTEIDGKAHDSLPGNTPRTRIVSWKAIAAQPMTPARSPSGA